MTAQAWSARIKRAALDDAIDWQISILHSVTYDQIGQILCCAPGKRCEAHQRDEDMLAAYRRELAAMDRKAARRHAAAEPEIVVPQEWELDLGAEGCWLDGAKSAWTKTIPPGWRIVLCRPHITELESTSEAGYEHAQPPRGFHGKDWPWQPDDR